AIQPVTSSYRLHPNTDDLTQHDRNVPSSYQLARPCTEIVSATSRRFDTYNPRYFDLNLTSPLDYYTTHIIHDPIPIEHLPVHTNLNQTQFNRHTDLEYNDPAFPYPTHMNNPMDHKINPQMCTQFQKRSSLIFTLVYEQLTTDTTKSGACSTLSDTTQTVGVKLLSYQTNGLSFHHGILDTLLGDTRRANVNWCTTCVFSSCKATLLTCSAMDLEYEEPSAYELWDTALKKFEKYIVNNEPMDLSIHIEEEENDAEIEIIEEACNLAETPEEVYACGQDILTANEIKIIQITNIFEQLKNEIIQKIDETLNKTLQNVQ
ncbi:hypothetical protein L9F63_024384, partial [Diploptera punctata]